MRDDPQLLNASNLAFVEELYGRFQADPNAVPEEWRRYFAGWPAAGAVVAGPSFEARGLFHAASGTSGASAKQAQVDELVRRWRERGHLVARLDPLDRARSERRDLELAAAGLSSADLASSFAFQGRTETLAAIVERLKTAWSGSIGVQFMHIDDDAQRAWLVERFESPRERPEPTREERIAILEGLGSALAFETTIQKKFLGAKSFSLEGHESLIPMLRTLVEHCGAQGIEDVVLGMAHRGRLNVLAHIAGKRPRDIFREFADLDAATYHGRGDVKYHLGWSMEHATRSGRSVSVTLCSNPSHLEFVNTVALGRARARSTRRDDPRSEHGLAVLLHGDAAFAGQGIVQETLNLSRLEGYQTGGTLHVVVNNQVGFTTDPDESRSTPYCTDVALMLHVPILHVNAADPEAVCAAVRIALDFRRQFASEVVIDLVGFRRHGHNESDEPAFTQPLLYGDIRKRAPARELYLDRLVRMELVTREQGEALHAAARARFESEFEAMRASDYAKPEEPKLDAWKGFAGGADAATPELDTGVDAERLAELLVATTKLPEGFKPHPKIEHFLEARLEMALGRRVLDWSAGEALAFASLAVEGVRVRLSGQDCERGTFTHRHAVLHDPATGAEHATFAHLAPDQAPVEIVNSPLSEAGVMGFEYGFSLDYPEALVLWEAQFGDFVNAAQVIWDQFLSSAEDKWKHGSGLALLLPHAFEGQGPEHSSARLERFLASCANDNVQVCYPTTPAQMFHLLRRQAKRALRKPLVVMTPKSLLRHPRATSKLDELASGHFRRILVDAPTQRGAKVERVLLCTGKLYYELVEERDKRGLDTPVLRLEQLYPLSLDELRAALAPWSTVKDVVWVQEEPENMGAWRFVQSRFAHVLPGLRCVARPEAASPATGSQAAHKVEQAELVERAL
ncbi:MAG: 2-oxoglutarate dehydrogenase E1 component [Planctomycetes bacterium]|nr:2-oxoglutarate dehydrogenase E1 component [Planctomycetota bacterium]